MLVSEEVDVRTRKINREIEGHYIVIKESIFQEDKPILSVYVTNNTASKYMRQKLKEMKGEIDQFTIVVGEFNILLLVIDRTNSLKISKEIDELNSTNNQIDLIDTYRLPRQIMEE